MGKLRKSGGYRDTCSFQTTTVIYDATVWFCEKFVSSRSRMVDQMVQAAKQGKSAGAQFWGCSNYPKCKSVVKV